MSSIDRKRRNDLYPWGAWRGAQPYLFGQRGGWQAWARSREALRCWDFFKRPFPELMCAREKAPRADAVRIDTASRGSKGLDASQGGASHGEGE